MFLSLWYLNTWFYSYTYNYFYSTVRASDEEHQTLFWLTFISGTWFFCHTLNLCLYFHISGCFILKKWCTPICHNIQDSIISHKLEEIKGSYLLAQLTYMGKWLLDYFFPEKYISFFQKMTFHWEKKNLKTE